MNPQKHAEQADQQLREAFDAFERSVLPAPAPALPAFLGLLRALGGLTRFALAVTFDRDRRDPIDLEPRVLRA